MAELWTGGLYVGRNIPNFKTAEELAMEGETCKATILISREQFLNGEADRIMAEIKAKISESIVSLVAVSFCEPTTDTPAIVE